MIRCALTSMKEVGGLTKTHPLPQPHIHAHRINTIIYTNTYTLTIQWYNMHKLQKCNTLQSSTRTRVHAKIAYFQRKKHKWQKKKKKKPYGYEIAYDISHLQVIWLFAMTTLRLNREIVSVHKRMRTYLRFRLLCLFRGRSYRIQ